MFLKRMLHIRPIVMPDWQMNFTGIQQNKWTVLACYILSKNYAQTVFVLNANLKSYLSLFFFPFLFLLSLQRSHKRKTQCLLLPVVSVHTPWRARRCMNVTNVQLLPTIKYSHVWFLCSDLIKYLSVNMYALSLKPQKYHLKFSIIFFINTAIKMHMHLKQSMMQTALTH